MEAEREASFIAFAATLVAASTIGDFASAWKAGYTTVDWLWEEIGVSSTAMYARLFEVARTQGLPTAQAYFQGDKEMAVATLKTLVDSSTGSSQGKTVLIKGLKKQSTDEDGEDIIQAEEEPTSIFFEDQHRMEAWLLRRQIGELCDESGPVAWSRLNDTTVYHPNYVPSTTLFNLQRAADNAIRAREDELGLAMQRVLVEEGCPASEVEVVPHGRVLIVDGEAIYEVDACVVTRGQAWMGERKSVATGVKQVKKLQKVCKIADDRKVFEGLRIQPVFMADFVPERVLPSLQRYCKEQGVKLMRRSGSQIKVVALARNAIAFMPW